MAQKKKEVSREKTKNPKQKPQEEQEELLDIAEILAPLKKIKLDKGYLIVGAIIIGVILLILGGIWYSNASKNFFYNGIKFQKSYEGNIAFYTALIPILNNQNQVVKYIKIDFRNDPRVLKRVPIDTLKGILFVKDKPVYVAYDSMGICEYNGLAAINLGIFFDQIEVEKEAGLADSPEAIKANLTYVNCETHPNNTVIHVKEGDTTAITQTARNCYEITFKDCEILEALERFELAILEQYMSQFS